MFCVLIICIKIYVDIHFCCVISISNSFQQASRLMVRSRVNLHFFCIVRFESLKIKNDLKNIIKHKLKVMQVLLQRSIDRLHYLFSF